MRLFTIRYRIACGPVLTGPLEATDVLDAWVTALDCVPEIWGARAVFFGVE